MRTAEDYLAMAERALDRFDSETDPKKRKALVSVARGWLAQALAEMERIGITNLRHRAEQLSGRLDP